MAGVGKTALAVHWARQVAGRFPDGQLYVNLRGYDAGAAVTPEEAAGWFLVALGVPAAQIPAGAQARCGLYRSVLAGRRVLIVLDNARDAGAGAAAAARQRGVPGGGDQPVRPGRAGRRGGGAAAAAGPAGRRGGGAAAGGPAGPRAGGRRTRGGRRAGRPVRASAAGAGGDGGPGRRRSRAAAGGAGRAAGRRRDAGAAAAGQPPGGDGPGRLDVLETGDPATSLRQLLSWSHRQLTSPAAQMFALLGVHCGPDITVPAAASLAGVPRADAGRALAELADASLVAEHRPGRYVMHDLVRGYAAGHARQALGQAGIREAIGRSLDHYLHTVLSLVRPPPPFTAAPPAPGVVPEQLAGEAGLAGLGPGRAPGPAPGHRPGRRGGLHHPGLADLGLPGLVPGRPGVLGRLPGRRPGRAGRRRGRRRPGRAGLDPCVASAGTARSSALMTRAAPTCARPWTTSGGPVTCPARPGRTCSPPAPLQLQGRLGRGGRARRAGPGAVPPGWRPGTGRGRPWPSLGECHARLGNYDLARGYARQALEAASGGWRPHEPGLCVECAGLGALPARAAPPGDQLLPASPGPRAPAENPAGPQVAGQPAGRVSATPARPPVTCPPPVRPGSRPCRSSTTWDCRTATGSAPGSSKPARPARQADRQAGTPASCLAPLTRMSDVQCDRAEVGWRQ